MSQNPSSTNIMNSANAILKHYEWIITAMLVAPCWGLYFPHFQHWQSMSSKTPIKFIINNTICKFVYCDQMFWNMNSTPGIFHSIFPFTSCGTYFHVIMRITPLIASIIYVVHLIMILNTIFICQNISNLTNCTNTVMFTPWDILRNIVRLYLRTCRISLNMHQNA